MNGWNYMKHYYWQKKIFTVINKSLKYITDADYTHTKRVCKNFEINNLREYHDLPVQSDTLLLADIDSW